MQLVQPSRYTSTCRYCHLPIAETDPLEIPLIGHPPKLKKMQKLFELLGKHLKDHHPEQFASGAALCMALPRFLIWDAFIHEDPTIQPSLEPIRAGVFPLVRRNSMTDDSITQIVAHLGLDSDDALKVNGAMKALRDACCEFGPFAPKVPEASRIVPA